MSAEIKVVRTAERPDWQFWLTDAQGNLIDLSTGYAFELKIGSRGSAAVLTKTSGFTGAAGAGTEPDGTPNLTWSPAAGDTDSLTGSKYTGQIKATSSSLDRIWQFAVTVQAPIT